MRTRRYASLHRVINGIFRKRLMRRIRTRLGIALRVLAAHLQVPQGPKDEFSSEAAGRCNACKGDQEKRLCQPFRGVSRPFFLSFVVFQIMRMNKFQHCTSLQPCFAGPELPTLSVKSDRVNKSLERWKYRTWCGLRARRASVRFVTASRDLASLKCLCSVWFVEKESSNQVSSNICRCNALQHLCAELTQRRRFPSTSWWETIFKIPCSKLSSHDFL